jgi:hypothetical protein
VVRVLVAALAKPLAGLGGGTTALTTDRAGSSRASHVSLFPVQRLT